jgi:hypothetical protein
MKSCHSPLSNTTLPEVLVLEIIVISSPFSLASFPINYWGDAEEIREPHISLVLTDQGAYSVKFH